MLKLGPKRQLTPLQKQLEDDFDLIISQEIEYDQAKTLTPAIKEYILSFYQNPYNIGSSLKDTLHSFYKTQYEAFALKHIAILFYPENLSSEEKAQLLESFKNSIADKSCKDALIQMLDSTYKSELTINSPSEKSFITLEDFLKNPIPENVARLNLQETLTSGPYQGCSILFRLVTDKKLLVPLKNIVKNLTKEQWSTFDIQAKAKDGTTLMWWLVKNAHHALFTREGPEPSEGVDAYHKYRATMKCLNGCKTNLTPEQWQKLDLQAKPNDSSKTLFDILRTLAGGGDEEDGEYYANVLHTILENQDIKQLSKLIGIPLLECLSFHCAYSRGSVQPLTDQVLRHLPLEQWANLTKPNLTKPNCDGFVEKYIKRNRWKTMRDFNCALLALKKNYQGKDLQEDIQNLFSLAEKAESDGHLEAYMILGDFLREIGDYANSQSAYQKIHDHERLLHSDAFLHLADMYFTGLLTGEGEAAISEKSLSFETPQAKQQRLLKAYEYVSKAVSHEHFVNGLRDNILAAYFYGATIYNSQLHPLVREFTTIENKDLASLIHFTALQVSKSENQALKQEIAALKAKIAQTPYLKQDEDKSAMKKVEDITMNPAVPAAALILSTASSTQEQDAELLDGQNGKRGFVGSSAVENCKPKDKRRK